MSLLRLGLWVEPECIEPDSSDPHTGRGPQGYYILHAVCPEQTPRWSLRGLMCWARSTGNHEVLWNSTEYVRCAASDRRLVKCAASDREPRRIKVTARLMNPNLSVPREWDHSEILTRDQKAKCLLSFCPADEPWERQTTVVVLVPGLKAFVRRTASGLRNTFETIFRQEMGYPRNKRPLRTGQY